MASEPFNLVVGSKLNQALHIRAYGVFVQNFTSQYVRISDRDFIPPNSSGGIPLDGVVIAEARFEAPPSVSQPVGVVGQTCFLAYVDYPIPPTGGPTQSNALQSQVTLERFARAAIPAAGNAGRVISLTDYDRGLWLDDGTRFWSIDNEIFDPRRYGAVWDGVADDSAAMTAMNAAMPASGSLVSLPPGAPLISSTVIWNKRCVVQGAGFSEAQGIAAGTQFVKASTLNGPLFRITANGVCFRDFVIDGQGGNGGDGLSIEANRVDLENFAVFRQGQDGIRIGTAAGVNCNAGKMRHVFSRGNGRDGVRFDDASSNANAWDLNGLGCSDNTGWGLQLLRAIENVFTGLHVENNATGGVLCASPANANVFVGGDWNEANGPGGAGPDLQVNLGATQNVFVGVGLLPAKTTWNDPTGLLIGLRTDLLGFYVKGSLQFPEVRASHSIAQAVATGVQTALAFDTTRFDTDATMHNNAVNNSRLTANQAGRYQITATVQFAAGAGTYRECNFRVNGATFITANRISPVAGNPTIMTATTLWTMAAADYVECMVNQDTAGNLNVDNAGSYSPEFSMVRVG